MFELFTFILEILIILHLCSTQTPCTVTQKKQTNPSYFFDDIAIQNLALLGYDMFMSVLTLIHSITHCLYCKHRNLQNAKISLNELQNRAKGMGVPVQKRTNTSTSSASSIKRKLRQIDQLFDNLQTTCGDDIQLRSEWLARLFYSNPSTITAHPKIAKKFAQMHQSKQSQLLKKHKLSENRISNLFFTMQKRNLSFRDMQNMRASVSFF